MLGAAHLDECGRHEAALPGPVSAPIDCWNATGSPCVARAIAAVAVSGWLIWSTVADSTAAACRVWTCKRLCSLRRSSTPARPADATVMISPMTATTTAAGRGRCHGPDLLPAASRPRRRGSATA